MDLIELLRKAVDNKNYKVLVTNLGRCEETNCDINHMTRAGDGLIHRAVKTGNIEIVNLLLKYGADINLLDNDEVTPFQLAVQQGDYEMISFLRKHGASIPLEIVSIAIESGYDEELVEFLLKEGAPIGSAKELVYEILDKNGDDEYGTYTGILNLLNSYFDIKNPDFV